MCTIHSISFFSHFDKQNVLFAGKNRKNQHVPNYISEKKDNQTEHM